jgi:hypothetical protein
LEKVLSGGSRRERRFYNLTCQTFSFSAICTTKALCFCAIFAARKKSSQGVAGEKAIFTSLSPNFFLQLAFLLKSSQGVAGENGIFAPRYLKFFEKFF